MRSTHNPDINEEQPDELEVFDREWRKHISTLKPLAPNAILVFIYGNHEFRILKFLEQCAPKLRKTVIKAWINMVRCDGQVLYMGDNEDPVRIGPLLVMHGNRTTVKPATSVYNDLGGQLSAQFGHVHRMDEYIRRGADFDVVVVASGCLCKTGHYLRGRARVKQTQGTSVMSVDLNSRYVHIDNLKFEKDRGRLWVRFERKMSA
jgi:hypothetical protein